MNFYKNLDGNATHPTDDISVILNNILEQLELIDFTEYALKIDLDDIIDEDEEIDDSSEDDQKGNPRVEQNNSIVKLNLKDYKILFVEALREQTLMMGHPVSDFNGETSVYSGTHWRVIDSDTLNYFLREAGKKIGVPKLIAMDTDFTNKCVKQLQVAAHISSVVNENITKLNFQNGTLVFQQGTFSFKAHDYRDLITYVLPYNYEPTTTCPKFQRFLDRVLPQRDKQLVLAEFFASCFSTIKHEKVLIAFGTGANGKSVLLFIITSTFGEVNVISNSLESLTHPSGYYRGQLAGKLLNYSGEISTKVSSDEFKKLASREPTTARYPYGRPFEVKNYARLAFNCNELPETNDTSEGFYRRFLIVPFDEYIPKDERNKHLAEEIIATELPGIMNWILEGLVRLEEQEAFSPCESSDQILEWYKQSTDTVHSFIESDLFKEVTLPARASELHEKYLLHCKENGFNVLGDRDFYVKLKSCGLNRSRRAEGIFYSSS